MRAAGIRLAVLLMLFCGSQQTCHAETIFLGPTPYLSAADSPFAEYLDGPNFYLEDFEDGELNTPGIFQPNTSVIAPWFFGEVLEPGNETDSVDGDDGAIDGWGRDGHSFQSRGLIQLPTLPPRNQLYMDFAFDNDLLGFNPNAFGFALTDVPTDMERDDLTIVVDVTDYDGNRFSRLYDLSTNDMMSDGGTAEDVFLGMIGSNEISQLRLRLGFTGVVQNIPHFEIDHVQYGSISIPEPTARRLCGIAALTAATLALGSRKNSRANFESRISAPP